MRLTALLFASCLIAPAVLMQPSPAAAADSTSATVAVSASFASRTSLKVSSQLLQFDVSDPASPATAAVDFSAGARTRQGGEVVLTVESVHAIQGPGGAADVDAAVTFAGEGTGTLSGALQPSSSTVAGRWTGSGLRTGRLVFALRAGASGAYTLPVRFILTAP
jgi:hypothetical protein